jgi:hypothetical protein
MYDVAAVLAMTVAKVWIGSNIKSSIMEYSSCIDNWTGICVELSGKCVW